MKHVNYSSKPETRHTMQRKSQNAFRSIQVLFTVWKRECGKSALSQNDFQNIDQLIQQQPDITIHEIMEKLQLHVSDETVRKAILKLGYVYKKKSLHASEQERPRCQGEAEKLERTSVGERRKSSGISRRKWCKHGHDKTLCPFQKE